MLILLLPAVLGFSMSAVNDDLCYECAMTVDYKLCGTRYDDPFSKADTCCSVDDGSS